jgi:hypothetical protein
LRATDIGLGKSFSKIYNRLVYGVHERTTPFETAVALAIVVAAIVLFAYAIGYFIYHHPS